MRSVVVFGVLICLCLVFAAESDDNDINLEEEVTIGELQLLKDAQDAKGQTTNGNDAGKNRKKRQIFPNVYYNSYSPFVGNGLLRDNVYDPVNYVQRLPYLPNAYRFNNLPIFRFFNRFFPVGVVQAENILTRNYVRFNSAYTEAYSDFRALPVYNIREIATTSVSSYGPDLRADVYGFQGGSVRLLRQGCHLDGIDNANFPCIYLELPNVRYGNVVRRFSYIRGFGTGILGNQFVAK